MNALLLFSLVSTLVLTCSHEDLTQQVTLSCPSRPEMDRGPPGVPGKRGAKGTVITIKLYTMSPGLYKLKKHGALPRSFSYG